MECDKRTYETRKEAEGDLKGLRERHGKHKYALYTCPICGQFHINTITKKVLKPNKKDKYPIEIPAKIEPKQKKSKRKSK